MVEDSGRRLAEAVGAVIGEVRRQRGLTLDDLAARSDLHRTTIGLAERGVRHLTIASASQIANALDMSLAELVEAAQRRVRR